MALSIGTNCGFVTVAPTASLGSSGEQVDTKATVFIDESPATAVKIVEIGWYCYNATEEANFEVGLYAADGATVPVEAGTLLEVERTNAKGTTAGWKRVTVEWDIDSSTDYWLGVQLDDTNTTTYIEREGIAVSPGGVYISSATTLSSDLNDVDLASFNNTLFK